MASIVQYIRLGSIFGGPAQGQNTCGAADPTQPEPLPRPPLLGDAEGHFRVRIVGNSGSGKSTLGAELAALLGVPHIALDELFWEPGWRKTPADAFRAKVRAAMAPARCPRGWVADGDYTRRLGGVVSNELGATDVIWLDPPLLLYFPRLCWRTLVRLLGWGPPCSPGCEEAVSRVFSERDSIIWWRLARGRLRAFISARLRRAGSTEARETEARRAGADADARFIRDRARRCLTNHWTARKRYAEPYRVDGVHAGGKLRRIGGWGGELDAWKRDVRAMVLRRAQGTDVPLAGADGGAPGSDE
ncbi:hypothetical protein C2E23DRAFT_899291 [Lenzites betulinus]|nr:hypothetical protein C2E23DRAFT_899291 [Lenzites betulinus]